MYRLFLQQNKCAQIIFATFQAIRKLSRYPKLSRLSGNFLDHPENMQPIRKRFRLSRNFSDHQENIQPIRKISSLSGKHPAYPENIQPIRKLSSLSGNFSGYPETFQAIQKLSRSSGKYPAYPENFQTIRKKSRLSGNFPKGPETSQCNFKGYAQKLSGRAKTFRMAMPPCHPGFWDSVLETPCSYYKAETTFTFHFPILTLSSAFLSINNREMKSESGFSFAMASKPFC